MITTTTFGQCHSEFVPSTGYGVASARPSTAPAFWRVFAMGGGSIVRIDRHKPDHKYTGVSDSGCRGRT